MTLISKMQAVEHDLNHEMILLRRRMLGLTQAHVADSLGVSQGFLSKLEQGLKEIDEPLLDKLCDVLRCRRSFFAYSERIYGAPLSTHPMFRKHASVGQKVLDKLLADVNARIAHFRLMLSGLEMQPDFPLPQYDLDDLPKGAVQAAQYVRRAWQLPDGPIPNLTVLCERAGCLVFACDMSEAKIDGISYRIAGLPPLIFLNKDLPGDRWRFTLAHELGHLVMHAYPNPEMEDQANEFASELLMPEKDIGRDLRNIDLARAGMLKPIWKVSMGALLVRAKRLQKITEGQSTYLWRTMSMLGYRTAEPAELSIPRERTTLVPSVFEHYKGQLEYNEEEISELLGLYPEDVPQLYELSNWKHRLQLVDGRQAAKPLRLA
ncbi:MULTISPECIES: ImmA/IrrE family metallo-endopeptidase [Chromobacterium]|uniref:helix-turn-helix domain-containing protein n=1 Tax=Chromobacterium TaxID=535 RepID=UPI001F3B8018|nr:MULTISPECIES: ImmA/IrrE family metallo-endopeptidase [Chromobacterium]MCS3802680.1 Zn-dependent peptidase ImmA (M78 family)/DNA-binding Xre family transcriptional regulator [Chromobacterium alkanivorans]MCS3817006.1 Zn-dependent peptidase ImmA (M78 family)/DNA-binding Xre family transcriptional regulator [Chromobacterium alkanivorans]MCS3872046.1 Zn-dependent peptidase ImmA (M78 family)/DNA-binding Xre family transcriptional regulator [Chromobacterium alkanivorans]